ncbi:hypothetical protein [Streptomyces sp. NPDC000410]|uniref:hypothetical protein n=1 Tax=Streptomyces sp. NPDC000410 TaxID=3154254 RepID=UPI0033201C9A
MLKFIVRHHNVLTLTAFSCGALSLGLAEFLGDGLPSWGIVWTAGLVATAGMRVCTARLYGRSGAPAGAADLAGGAS